MDSVGDQRRAPGHGAFSVGSRARIRQPRLPTAVWTVTVVEPGQFFEWKNATPGLKTTATHRIEARGTNAAGVALALGWSGPLAPLVRLLFRTLSSRYVEMEAHGLKRRCEMP